MTGLARDLVPEWPTGKVAQALFELQGESKEQAEKLMATKAKIEGTYRLTPPGCPKRKPVGSSETAPRLRRGAFLVMGIFYCLK